MSNIVDKSSAPPSRELLAESSSDGDYSAGEIDVLEGLEAVRKRPGMYIGGTGTAGLHQLVWEVVDNAVDEAMAGYCDLVKVTIHEDGSCEVSDNGRGIPVDEHPEHPNITAAELVFTRLHAGAKFGEKSYSVSGGLHGVGISVVNALSSRLDVEILRNDSCYTMSFMDGGQVSSPFEQKSADQSQMESSNPDGTGTTVRFWSDTDIFDDVNFRAQTIKERLRNMSFLNRGLKILFRDLRPGSSEKDWVEYYNKNGIMDFVRHLNKSKEPLFEEIGTFTDRAEDREIEVAFQWNTGFNDDGIHSYVNGISTHEGGTHEEGLRKSLTSVINRYARKFNKLKDNDENFRGEDIREGLTAILSVKMKAPQFEGQTKRKLGNSDMTSFVERATNEYFKRWLEENPNAANLIVDKSLLARRARVEAADARKAVRRKSELMGGGLPGKLSDCSSRNPDESELYIVEGDSAGGSAKKARDPRIMAILAIRGKILNVERSPLHRMIKNEEIQAIVSAIGASFGEDFDIQKIRYNKITLLCDADVDGSHISVLLLTFFFRQMRDLVEGGHIYRAQPPLYSTLVGKEKVYLKDDIAKNKFLEERPNHKAEFQRLKGLGEMDAEELWDTTLNPDTRTLLQITVDQAAIADEVFSKLMGDVVEDRKKFIQENAGDVRFLDI